jgi:serine protease Do
MKFSRIFISSIVIAFLLSSNHQFNQPFIEVSKKANPCIVSIISEKELVQRQFNPFFNDPFFEDFFPEFKQRGESLGSGVIIDDGGYIITNNHVIDGADKIKVILYNKNEYEASVIGVDPLSDLAIIQIDSDQPLSIVKMGDSDRLDVGEWVIAIGSPFGLHLNHTVTAGIVSAVGRSNVMSKLTYEDFIQHDAAINPGNSGGALLNLDGELVGINTAIATDGYSRSNAGVGFAIPINQAKRVIEDLLDDGIVSRGWLGVQIQSITDEISRALELENKNGALIVSIVPDSPAADSGLMEEDVVIKVDNNEIENDRDLVRMISLKHPGDYTTFTVIRGDEKLRVSVVLGERPDQKKISDMNSESDSFDILGLKVSQLNNRSGLKIVSVGSGSVAQKNGLRKDDIIVKIGRKVVSSKDEYHSIIDTKEKGDVIMLRIERNGNQSIYAFTIR